MDVESLTESPPVHTIARSALLLSSLGLLAMAFTLAWHMSLAALYGTSSRLDAFWAAYAIPKAIVDSLHLGILSFVFILVWRLSTSLDDRSRLASALVNLTLLITAAVIVTIVAAAGPIVRFIGPGLPPPDQLVSAHMLRWLTLMLVPSALAGVVGAALYAEGHFAAFSIARVFAPAVQVAVLLLAAPRLGSAAPMWAALAGPVAMGLVCLFLLKRMQFSYTPTLHLTGKEARMAIRVFLVLCAFAVLERANQTTDRFFATLVGPGALSVLEFSWRLEIPISQLLSLAVGIPTFVLMAHATRRETLADMRPIVSANLRLIGLFVVPLIGLLVVLRQPLVDVLFRRGAFTAESAALLATLVPALGVIFAVRSFGVVMVLGFLTLGRTTRLILVLSAEVAFNTILNVLVYQRFGLRGIVAATAASMVASNLYMWRAFTRDLATPSASSLFGPLARPMAAAAISLLLLAGAYSLAGAALRSLNVPALAILAGFAAAFGVTHLAVARALGELEVSLRPGRIKFLLTHAPLPDEPSIRA